MQTLMKEPAVATVIITSLNHGAMEVGEDRLVLFVTPLLGFERLKRFHIYQTKPGPTYWMQSAEDVMVAFCMLAPFQAGLDTRIDITPNDVTDIGAAGVEDIEVYSLVVLNRDPNLRRTNLRAPILVCRSTRRAKQVVLADPKLPIKFLLRDINVLDV
jgi:flagellar assembly factor FliW